MSAAIDYNGVVADAVERPADLYSVDLADFVARRTALAAQLKASGDRDAAAAVASMRKPPRSAWALNVVARTEPEVIERVLDSARRVASAIVDGGDELRAAQREYTRAVTATLDAAASRSGLTGDAVLEKMRSTLLAAGADPDGEVASNLRAGTLSGDVAAPGFSVAGLDTPGIGAAADAPQADADRVDATADTEQADTEQADTEQAERETSAAEQEAAAAAAAAAAQRAAAATAERRQARERTRLEREIDRRTQRLERLTAVADAAEAAALEARSAADRAADELRSAEERLAELERPEH